MLRGACLCGSVHWTFNSVPESATIHNQDSVLVLEGAHAYLLRL